MAATTRTNINDPTKEVPFTVLDRRRYSFFMIDNEVIDDYACLIGIYALGVYTVLSRFANREGVCFPSLNTIAKRLGISKPSVITALGALETYGLIAKDSVARHGSADPRSPVCWPCPFCWHEGSITSF